METVAIYGQGLKREWMKIAASLKSMPMLDSFERRSILKPPIVGY
jgi:hypothetical protein